MRELLEETLAAISSRGRTVEEIQWVGSEDGRYYMTWEQFSQLAKGCEYDSGFGAQQVASDLVVIGPDWWLDRYEYDGSEDWTFHTRPEPFIERILPTRLICNSEEVGWRTLQDMNPTPSYQGEPPTALRADPSEEDS